jgi:hypothetical protein
MFSAPAGYRLALSDSEHWSERTRLPPASGFLLARSASARKPKTGAKWKSKEKADR